MMYFSQDCSYPSLRAMNYCLKITFHIENPGPRLMSGGPPNLRRILVCFSSNLELVIEIKFWPDPLSDSYAVIERRRITLQTD